MTNPKIEARAEKICNQINEEIYMPRHKHPISDEMRREVYHECYVLAISNGYLIGAICGIVGYYVDEITKIVNNN